MIFRPADPSCLWDTWLFEWDGRMHLYYLASPPGVFAVGHAISDDLVHWEPRPDLITPHWPFTGMIVRHKDRFVMGLGEELDQVQTTLFYESDDLEHWRSMPGSTRLRPVGPHYVSELDDRWSSVWWRDPYLFQLPGDDAWHALLCATQPDDGTPHSGAVLAHVRTHDFATWEHLPPIDGPTGKYFHNEVPEYFEHDGKHYVLFTTGSCSGLRVNTPTRRETVGTYYMIADQFEGPYRLPEEPMLIGAGHWRMASYVGRVIQFNGERLLYHHVRDDSDEWRGTWAAPKRLDIEPNGELAVRYWPGVEKLIAGKLAETPHVQIASPVAGSTHALTDDVAALQLQATVHFDAGRCGAILRANNNRGLLIALDHDTQQAEIGLARRYARFGWGSDRTNFLASKTPVRDDRFPHDTCKLSIQPGQTHHLRCLMRGEIVEVYLNDRWLFTSHMPGAPATGRVELLAEGGVADFTDIGVDELEPWQPAASVGQVTVT